jgi:bacterioferritin (cytochrome b1)
MADPDEPLDREKTLEALSSALRLQYRSALAYALAAGSLTGFELVGLAVQLQAFAAAELDDVRRLVEKVVALEGEPATEVAPLAFHPSGRDVVSWLIDTEGEVLQALGKVIDATGGDAESEALEHRLEHAIMRKREQVETLQRAARG